MPDCVIHLTPGKTHAAEKGHPWIYTDEIENYSGTYENGDIVSVVNARGHFVGRGFINDVSKISVRIMTRDPEEAVDTALIRRRLREAETYRRDIMPQEEAYRLIYGESDFLPGLTVDRYGDYFVLQSLALGIDRFKDDVVRILREDFGAKGIIERSDVKVRELEGMTPWKGFLTEPFDPVITMTENGVRYRVDLMNGQKTGFFLDQKENRQAIHRLVKGRTVLDCFTHTGSFALNAGIAGAKSVLGIDISEDAVAMASDNARLNGLEDTVRFEAHNAFDVLPVWSRAGQTYQVVILDPPAFTKSRGSVSGAVRGYREINLRGIRMVEPGGYFISCSCSHFMKEDMLRRTIAEAAAAAGRILRQVEFRTQSADHPILMSSDESYYLKFFIFQVF
ncbi:class I SAM-dependent rRNA methyltransferase [Proteiniclasticum sp. QWL-01]|uniref:class I SAM-dependent rRNA methyltransferase n=1 Tax=Proteiniclasticum sp. QWL-01 TaxID=3036945 RepID=UPI00240FDA5A|nr:class I SAM-dependent rRNA methyltransferase [Proteiniclasticum sp. QWL-01]WFF72594.1 class I SAM-dependent rRNA methyltransferase [Proteiniclasticum sp. QWL-01]